MVASYLLQTSNLGKFCLAIMAVGFFCFKKKVIYHFDFGWGCGLGYSYMPKFTHDYGYVSMFSDRPVCVEISG